MECERLCEALKRVEGLAETVVLLDFWREDFCFLVEFIGCFFFSQKLKCRINR